MKAELDEALVKDFPLLFRNRYASMNQTAMCWGFECGDGWEPIIRRAAEKLEPLIKAAIAINPEEKDFVPCASQVKEKFGTLRFYLSCGSDEMYEITEAAERESEGTCETCGASGAKMRGDGWIYQACDSCEETGRK